MNQAKAGEESFVIVEIAGTAYAMRSQYVKQLEMVENITPVPNAMRSVEGVVFSRGRVIPAVNLRVRFGFEKAAYDARTRLVVVSSGERLLGLIADSAREFTSIPTSAIQPPPEAVANASGNYVEGIANINGRIVIVLNLEQLINSTGDPELAATEPLRVNAEQTA